VNTVINLLVPFNAGSLLLVKELLASHEELHTWSYLTDNINKNVIY
jgi:hypothetical protein